MAVTVSDLLALPLLREGQIVAGVGGLTRKVCAVSFSDYPIIFSEEEYKLTSEGDLYICSYYLFREDKEKLYNRIRFYTKTKSSCFIISVGEHESLPADSIALANQNNYPIVLISDKIPYTAIIRTISETIILDEISADLEKKIDSLLYEKLTPDEEIALAKHFNLPESSYFMSAFFSLPEELEKNRLNDIREELVSRFREREFSIYRYRALFLLIIGLDKQAEAVTMKNVIQTSLDQLGVSYHLGLSALHQSSSSFSTALRQAYQSCRIGLYQNWKFTEFGQAPFFDLLYELRHNTSMIRYCQETLRPLQNYKQNHNIDLIETLRLFFLNNGSYKQTAADLFQHENTVRFRIAKAKSLLGMESDSYRFIKEVSLAIDVLTFTTDKM